MSSAVASRHWSDNPISLRPMGSGMAFQAVAVSRPYEQIVDQIASEIRSGRLSHGERLPTERELSVTFGVSRGVVREAVKVLGAMGLVEPRQGSGLFVQDDPRPLVTRALTLSVSPEPESVGHLFEFRGVLESFAAENAARGRSTQQARDITAAAEATKDAGDDIQAFGAADTALHNAIYEAAENPYLAVIASAIRDLQRDVAHLFRTFPGSIQLAARQHNAIADAIDKQDSAAAAAAMAAHVTYTSRTVEEIIQHTHERKEE